MLPTTRVVQHTRHGLNTKIGNGQERKSFQDVAEYLFKRHPSGMHNYM